MLTRELYNLQSHPRPWLIGQSLGWIASFSENSASINNEVGNNVIMVMVVYHARLNNNTKEREKHHVLVSVSEPLLINPQI